MCEMPEPGISLSYAIWEVFIDGWKTAENDGKRKKIHFQ